MVLKRVFQKKIYIADKEDRKKMERFLYSVENTALCPSQLCYFCCFNIRQVFVYCQSLSRNENTLIEKICY